MKQVCASCGKVNELNALYCIQCGKPLYGNQPVTRTPQDEIPEDTSSLEVNEKAEHRLTDLFDNLSGSTPPEPLSRQPESARGETKPESLFPQPHRTDTFSTLHMDASSIKDVFCEVCHHELHSPEDKFCSNCGAPQKQPLEKCRSCKTPLIPGAQYCHQCGLAVLSVPQMTLHMASNDMVFKIPPRAEVFTIGRNVPQQNNFVDLDLGPYGQRRVSRQHARFILRENKWYLEDLNSKAGTRVFNDRIPPFVPTPIEDNMTIYFAELKFKVSITE